MPPVRRLAAILAADVAGYSRLMGADEEGTHERLRAHLRDLIDPKIAEHRGRVVKNTGDGFLAEFASVVDTVRGAVEMQRSMAERIIAVVELSQSSWLVGGMLPGIERRPRKKLEPSPERLLAVLHRWRDEAVKAGGNITRIALAFEVGRDGFHFPACWL